MYTIKFNNRVSLRERVNKNIESKIRIAAKVKDRATN